MKKELPDFHSAALFQELETFCCGETDKGTHEGQSGTVHIDFFGAMGQSVFGAFLSRLGTGYVNVFRQFGQRCDDIDFAVLGFKESAKYSNAFLLVAFLHAHYAHGKGGSKGKVAFHDSEFAIFRTGNHHVYAVIFVDGAVGTDDFHVHRISKGISHGLFPFLHLFSLFDCFINGAHHVECTFRHIIMLACKDFLEASDGFFQRYISSRGTGELFSYEEWLRQESLDLSCAGNDDFVVVGKFFHTEDGDDILQFFVALEDSLYAAGYFVVFFAEYVRVKDTGSGVQGVNGRIDTQFCNGTVQYGGSIQMGEYACRSRSVRSSAGT